MQPHRLNIRTWQRPAETAWDDESLGRWLVEVVRRAVERKAAPPAALCIRPDRLDLFDLRQVPPLRMSPPLFLASLSRVEMAGEPPPNVVGLIGVFQVRERPDDPGVPVAMVFLEWGDCRWWQWRALIDPATGVLRDDTETIARAIDGDPRPARLGGWWSLGRRARLRMRMEPTEPQIVH